MKYRTAAVQTPHTKNMNYSFGSSKLKVIPYLLIKIIRLRIQNYVMNSMEKPEITSITSDTYFDRNVPIKVAGTYLTECGNPAMI